MFEHIQLLLSFVYALALTHLLASATELVLARAQVKFSWLLTLWMLMALILLFSNWMSFFSMSGVRNWSLRQVGLLFATAVVQYFTCSLVSPRVLHGRETDMSAFYQTHRRIISASFAGLGALAIAENLSGPPNSNALEVNAPIVLMIGIILVTALAKGRQLQWAASLALFALIVAWVAVFTVL